MRTLIITSSVDTTTDMLVNDVGPDCFIRLNYDRPTDWAIEIFGGNLKISSEILRLNFTNFDISKCIWRKPFTIEPEVYPYTDAYFLAEWKYLIFEIFFLLDAEGKRYLNRPIPDNLFGKHTQIRSAEKYFNVEKISTSINIPLGLQKNKITKSLSSTPFSDGSVLYSVDVTNQILDGSLWTIQKKITRSHDLTVVFVHGSIFPFQLSRDEFKGLDWRKDPFNLFDKWQFIKLPDELEKNIRGFMEHVDLQYGRLDFLSNHNGEDAVFLEVNRNGQWAWLDHKKKYGLFKKMREIYDPRIKKS